MKKILEFVKPASHDKKCNSPKFVRIVVIILILLLAVKILGLDDLRPPIYMQHSVNFLKTPIKLPEDYMVYDLSGKQMQLAGLTGDNITILAFWATWCGYCAREFPEMDSVVPYLSRHGVKIIPIARGEDTPDKITQFFNRGNIKNVESVIASSHSLYKQLGILAYPTFIAIDKNGMVFAKLRPQWGASNIFELFEKLGKDANSLSLKGEGKATAFPVNN